MRTLASLLKEKFKAQLEGNAAWPEDMEQRASDTLPQSQKQPEGSGPRGGYVADKDKRENELLERVRKAHVRSQRRGRI